MPLFKFLNRPKTVINTLKNGNPSLKLKVIGITGTRGKTVTTHYLKDLLTLSGKRVGYISSINYSADGENLYNDLSADSINSNDLINLLNEMSKREVDVAIVEMPVKGISEGAYGDIVLDSGIITNIDGFDRNVSERWDEYTQNKLNFINRIKDEGLLIFNGDDIKGRDWLMRQSDNILHQIYVDNVEVRKRINLKKYNLDGIDFNLYNDNFSLKHPGLFNVQNAMQAMRIAEKYLGNKIDRNAIAEMNTVRGRFEVLQKSPFTIVVDYAYNPIMIEESLRELNSIKKPGTRIISILGAAGERDRWRREAGIVSLKYSDITILTAEDPRSEKVMDINSEIHSFIERSGGVLVDRYSSTEELESTNYANLLNRIERVYRNGDHPVIAFDADDYSGRLDAIKFGISLAQEGDIIYITGKGHEQTLEFKGIQYEWSDHEAVEQALSTVKTGADL